MHEHRADWAITVQGIDSHVEFTMGERAVALTPGRLLIIPRGVLHRVRGIDESAFLLTIGGSTNSGPERHAAPPQPKQPAGRPVVVGYAAPRG